MSGIFFFFRLWTIYFPVDKTMLRTTINFSGSTAVDLSTCCKSYKRINNIDTRIEYLLNHKIWLKTTSHNFLKTPITALFGTGKKINKVNQSSPMFKKDHGSRTLNSSSIIFGHYICYLEVYVCLISFLFYFFFKTSFGNKYHWR